MKRTVAVLCALLGVFALGPAHADDDATITVHGAVEAPATHPAVPRTLYLESQKTNGMLGWVAPLEQTIEEPRPFTLRKIPGSGGTGREDLDVWFYRDIAGTGDPCPRLIDSTPNGGETGTVCAGATYAVIVLFAGARADFELSILPHAAA